MSGHLCVCLSQAGIVSKQLHIRSCTVPHYEFLVMFHVTTSLTCITAETQQNHCIVWWKFDNHTNFTNVRLRLEFYHDLHFNRWTTDGQLPQQHSLSTCSAREQLEDNLHTVLFLQAGCRSCDATNSSKQWRKITVKFQVSKHSSDMSGRKECTSNLAWLAAGRRE